MTDENSLLRGNLAFHTSEKLFFSLFDCQITVLLSRRLFSEKVRGFTETKTQTLEPKTRRVLVVIAITIKNLNDISEHYNIYI